jgi:toxin-antitoxin system PIN domain toxin
MTFLPDVNVWIALAVIEHEHHEPAAKWFESVGDNDLAFCRVSQMGLLRLLTNAHVMKDDQLTPSGAWQLSDRLFEQAKAIFEPEPEDLEEVWRGLTDTSKPQTNFWTDAYLAAFAQATGCTLVTFDRGVSRYKKTAIRIL